MQKPTLSLTLLAIILILCQELAFANTIKIPQDKPTIQAGVDAATGWSDTVLVAPGIYTGEGNKNISLKDKKIVLLSELGAERTIIDCEGDGRAFLFVQWDAYTEVNGFTIRNASQTAVLVGGSTINGKIENCIIENNKSAGLSLQNVGSFKVVNCIIRNNQRGGILAKYDSHFSLIKNCIIYGNSAAAVYSERGGGIYCDALPPAIENCTIFGNSAKQGGGIYAGYYNMSALNVLRIKNTIIWGNYANEGRSIFIGSNMTSFDISYSNIEEVWPGNGNITSDPIFVNKVQEDFHLHPASPCIDSGDPRSDFSFESLPNGERINMGAYGNTSEASSFDTIAVISDFYYPISCALETLITIKGRFFGDQQNTSYVQIEETIINHFVKWTDTLIAFDYPTNSIGLNDIILKLNNGERDTIESFQLHSPIGVYVKDTVSGIWASDCPTNYYVAGTVIVPEGESLTIEPGVNIIIDLDSAGVNAGFLVRGSLIAEGTENKPITFTVLGTQAKPGMWNGLNFNLNYNSDEVISLKHCIIENAKTGIVAGYKNIKINNCIIQNNSSDGVVWNDLIDNDSGSMKNCLVRNNGRWGVVCQTEFSVRDGYLTATIEKNTIENNNEGGIYVVSDGFSCSFCTVVGLNHHGYSNPVIKENIIRNNNGYAIKCYANGRTHSLFGGGVHYAWAHTNPRIERNIVYNNKGSFIAEAPWGASEPYLSESKPEIINCTFWNNGNIDLIAGDSSQISVTNSIFWRDGISVIDTFKGGTITINHSNFKKLYTNYGEGNISEEPEFTNPADHDFRLHCLSPCVNTGDPNSPFDPDGSIADMGALWFDFSSLDTEISDDIVACEEEEVLLMADGGVDYVWSGVNGFTSNSQTPVLSSVTPNRTGEYFVTITTNEGCLIKLSTHVTINSLPTAAISGNLEICSGNADTLTASGGIDYIWSSGDYSAATIVMPSATTVYTVTVTDSNGCADTAFTSVNVYELPTITLNEQDTFCINAMDILLTSGMPEGGVYSGVGVFNNIFKPSKAEIGINKLVYEFTDSNGCTNSASQEIIVKMCTTDLQKIKSEEDIKVFPNPSNGNLKVLLKNWNQVITVRITDIQGRVIFSKKSKSNEIQIGDIPKGVFFLQLLNDEYFKTLKLIIQ